MTKVKETKLIDCSCKICGKSFSNLMGLASHIRQIHSITAQKYYEKFYGKGYCKVCGNPTNFNSLSEGYYTYCSNSCMSIGTAEKRKQTCLQKYGVTNVFQRADVVEKTHTPEIIAQQKVSRKQTALDRYGVEYTLLIPSTQEKAHSSDTVDKQKAARAITNKILLAVHTTF